jgi:hypothetical protein
MPANEARCVVLLEADAPLAKLVNPAPREATGSLAAMDVFGGGGNLLALDHASQGNFSASQLKARAQRVEAVAPTRDTTRPA